jgi:hypothetical protein
MAAVAESPPLFHSAEQLIKLFLSSSTRNVKAHYTA